MNKRILFGMVLIFTAAFVFAQETAPEATGAGVPATTSEALPETTAEVTSEALPETTAEVTSAPAEPIPQSILNNQYYRESVRLNDQAKASFEEGDYDAAANYAEQAALSAQRSDAYVEMRLADNVFARAHSRYTWAGSVGAASRYPDEYYTASSAYDAAVEYRQVEDWEAVTEWSNEVLAALTVVQAPGGQRGPVAGSEPPRPAQGTLPAQYTVRRWSETGDCFSAIAGWSWVYGDVYQWRKLYDANKDKLPNPDNPHLIQPGMVLDIPSLGGEVRSGMWDPEAKY